MRQIVRDVEIVVWLFPSSGVILFSSILQCIYLCHRDLRALWAGQQPAGLLHSSFTFRFVNGKFFKNSTKHTPATLLLPIDVQLAQDCYDSVALNQDDATSLIDGLTGMLEFQSDLEYLIKPPSGYLLAGVDLQKELNDLRGQVTSNKITGEIDFETRVAKILAQAHDGHLAFRIDGLSIFSLSRPTGSLVSVSMNGTDTPKMYRYSKLIEDIGEGSKY